MRTNQYVNNTIYSPYKPDPSLPYEGSAGARITMAKSQSLQEPFLNALRKERIPVSIYLVNGIKLRGQVESFDQFVVLLKNTVSQMVYKHAISTIVPDRNVKAALADERANDEEAQNEAQSVEFED